jgi:serine/threonine-protein kinase
MNSLKNPFNFPKGTVIKGKWNQKMYVLLKELGYGANGTVYLVQNENGYAALKMSKNNMSITSEVNVLKAFRKVQGSSLGPSLLDVDDWFIQGSAIPFYVMEYIQGPNLLHFIKQKGPSWIGVMLSQLLRDLALLHEQGWVFGDLKPENLIVAGPPYRIRCIDVGGATIQGRAIKEFTEFFDRGYWGMGTRKAEPSYDLFSVAMIAVNLAYLKKFEKRVNGRAEIVQMIKKKQELTLMKPVLLKAINGGYFSAGAMRKELLMALSSADVPKKPERNGYPTGTGRKDLKKPLPSRKAIHKKKKNRRLLETLWIIVCLSFLYFVYLFIQLT